MYKPVSLKFHREYNTFDATLIDIFFLAMNITTLGFVAIFIPGLSYDENPRRSLFRRTDNKLWLDFMERVGTTNVKEYTKTEREWRYSNNIW